MKTREEKKRSDVNNICRYARFVIFVDSLCEVVNTVTREDYKTDIIAVVGMQYEMGVLVADQVLLEIGFARTRPYTECNYNKKFLMSARRAGGLLVPEKLARIYPALLACIEEVIIDTCAKWESSSDWFVKGVGNVPRGVAFTISRKDEFLYRQMLVEDIRHRRAHNLDDYACAVDYWLRRYKFSYYSEQHLKSLAGAQKVAGLLASYKDSLSYRDALMRLLKRSKKFALIERIIEVFNIDFSKEDPEGELISRKFEVRLPKLNGLWVRLRPQPGTHAKGCLVAEIGVVDQSKILKRKEAADGGIQFGTST